jgi:uncharacterized protein YuzB (UPF0349 family)
MGRTIEYCISNVSPGTRDRYRTCATDTNERQCLQRCGRCVRDSFAVVDGVVVERDHGAILDQFGDDG